MPQYAVPAPALLVISLVHVCLSGIWCDHAAQHKASAFVPEGSLPCSVRLAALDTDAPLIDILCRTDPCTVSSQQRLPWREGMLPIALHFGWLRAKHVAFTKAQMAFARV